MGFDAEYPFTYKLSEKASILEKHNSGAVHNEYIAKAMLVS